MKRVVAPAKLTLTLSITGVRPDGYHNLRAEMVSLSLADVLTFTNGGSGLTVTADPGTRAGALAETDANLITSALAAVGRTAAVHLVKRIPVGGGLGGGSSDAAAVLRWAACHDPAVALRLGADVPFSVAGGRALVEGIGERVTPMPFQARDFLLLVPPFGVDTSQVYEAWDEAPTMEGPNALTAAALRVEPRLADWRDALADLAACQPTLAGSGSTWFVEGGPAEAGTESMPILNRGTQQARLVRARTVPAGWEGDERR